MSEHPNYVAAVDAAAEAIGQRITDWTGHVIRQAAAYAVASALPLIEAAGRADERAKVAEEIREAANREDFEGTSWQAGMAYAHRIAQKGAPRMPGAAGGDVDA